MNSTQLLQGDFRDLCNALAPESIDAIVTDPPYLKQYIPLYEALSESAARVLKPGGSCFVLCGNYHLPAFMDCLSKHLTYWWQFAYIMKDYQNVVIWPRRMIAKWKPILWYVKGKPKTPLGLIGKPPCFDVIWGNGKNKQFHEWGQEAYLFRHIIEFFTNKGDTILDPMVGGGDCGLAALQSGRNFIGMDIDPAAIATTTKRLRAIEDRTCIPYLEVAKNE